MSDGSGADGPVEADFWFDPVCPYTWIASRWLLEVTAVRQVRVRWRLMSLQVLNEGREVDPEDPEGEWGEYLWAPVRVCAAVEQRYGQEALGRFYTALGERLQRGEWDGIPAALAALGLSQELAGAGGTQEYDPVVRASHAEALALVGEDVGTPVIAVREQRGAGNPRSPRGHRPGVRAAFFGPVVSPVPRGEQAGRLWDGLLLMAGVEGFFELRRPASPTPVVDAGPAL